ncbi:transposase [Rhodoferax sp. TBRC 17660]|uniref:Transposase n=1 Tax=Rhodoferax potami TaxID=3068338 RepID=A0ABU3KTC0_9BURK|nr:transposase [Rhodoferax sp. TBRC 17660]MDT7520672.1 transposase [Rhodoferax sp. TBRC 17660]
MDAAQSQLELLSAALAPVVPVIALSEDTNGDATGSNVADLDGERKKRRTKSAKPAQPGLPEHLPREDVVHSACAADCKCGACGTGLQQIGQDVSEVLDYEPGSFKVIRHIRPKFACTQCHTVTQAAAPARPIDRCMAGAGLIAHVMVSKYADHCPLYRQSQISAREDVILSPSTLCGWVGNGAALITPLAQALGRYVLKGYKVHSDDTPTRALGAGKGRAHLAGSGRMSGMIVTGETMRIQLYGSNTQKTVEANTPGSTSRGFAVCCR